MAAPRTAGSLTRRVRLAPLALGLMIGLVAGYGFRPGTSTAAGKPTCKPKVVVVTATPVGHARYTPGPRSGAATPLPHTTPVHPVPHLILGMITHPLHTVTAIQAQVNKHNKKDAFYLVPSQVVLHTLPQYGFKPPIHLVSPPKPFPRYAGRPVRKAVVKYGNRLYQVRVAQPGLQGSKGIWVIVTILPQTIRLGGIGQSPKVVAHEQHLADTNKKYAFLRNPSQVALKNAPQYGLIPPLTIVGKATAVKSTTGRPTEHVLIKSQGTVYDVYVAQFGKRGAKGIWSTAFIDVHQP